MACLVPLINFCDPVFKADITCATVNSEGYEVTNLLSADCQKRKKGFLSDRFIKPPVEITLKLPFDANIRYIKIGAEVGQQKSNGIEIYSTSSPYNSSMCSGSPSAFQKNTRPGWACSPVSERIASVVLNDGERGVVFYCPLEYGRHSSVPVPQIRNDFIQRPMTWKKRSVIAHVSSLTIRIFRTHGSSVPAVGSLEVWGGPSSCMPANQVSNIVSLWTTAHEKQTAEEANDVAEVCTTPVLLSKPDEPVADVPEEFLDAITWEIMAIPMVLPSGKVVDQRTLDLHAQAEANWGRHPSDPFTGIMFSEGCRPQLDSSLKSRIDRFLVLNQDRKDLKTVPRTVGRACPQICHQSISRFPRSQVNFHPTDNHLKLSLPSSAAVHDTLVPRGYRSTAQTIQNCGRSWTASSSFKRATDSEKESINSNITTKRCKLDHSLNIATPNEDAEDDIIFLSDESSTKKSENFSSQEDVASHEKRMDDSLDFALKSALSGLPSFTNPPAPKLLIKDCGSCKAVGTLYSLPCAHFLCRPCLVKVTKETPSKCQSCYVEFNSSDPILHHD